MSMAVLRLLWEFSEQAVEEGLVGGGLLIADSTEWLAGRALAWAGLPADLLLVSTGDRDLDSVQVGLQDALAQAAPQAAVAFLEAQVQALRDLTPAFLPVESETYRRRKEEESAAAKARSTKVSAKPEGGEAAGGRKKRVAKSSATAAVVATGAEPADRAPTPAEVEAQKRARAERQALKKKKKTTTQAAAVPGTSPPHQPPPKRRKVTAPAQPSGSGRGQSPQSVSSSSSSSSTSSTESDGESRRGGPTSRGPHPDPAVAEAAEGTVGRGRSPVRMPPPDRGASSSADRSARERGGLQHVDRRRVVVEEDVGGVRPREEALSQPVRRDRGWSPPARTGSTSGSARERSPSGTLDATLRRAAAERSGTESRSGGERDRDRRRAEGDVEREPRRRDDRRAAEEQEAHRARERQEDLRRRLQREEEERRRRQDEEARRRKGDRRAFFEPRGKR